MLPIFLTFFDRTAMGAFGDDFCFTLITNQAALAAEADAAGVDQIGIDIERMNKVARQRYLPNARISDHEISDLDRLSPVVRRAALFARLNALHDNSNQEVEAALAGGVTVLMLPFFSMPAEAERFVRLVDRRAKVTLLLETAAAVVRLHDILAVGGIDEVIVGLNDLRLSLGVTHEFEVVPSDLMTMIADSV
jgi:citrate lyase beta subunit